MNTKNSNNTNTTRPATPVTTTNEGDNEMLTMTTNPTRPTINVQSDRHVQDALAIAFRFHALEVLLPVDSDEREQAHRARTRALQTMFDLIHLLNSEAETTAYADLSAAA